MFNRPEYKVNAKLSLQGRKSVPVLATLVSALIILAVSVGNQLFNKSEKNGALISIAFSVLMIFAMGATMLAYVRLIVVMSKTSERPPFSEFINGYEMCLRGFLAYIWQQLFIFLWSLLFFIPGIIKTYAYSQMFFLLAEYPSMGVKKAMNISKMITRGHKFDLFVMELSFAGWHLLACLTMGILELWIVPYETMAFQNAYQAIKSEALQQGIISESDLH